ncbi:hypothetical protein B0T17DRAFT_509436 [Bombardia bombarda]|uniref:Uncharacterized protein n=1 Tax=Bombardia bombarda TaxID=252184 RepID=A0AA39WLX9_9PEZI|nr:hypothetical protein B0T17DRAFT_509436 [Bombardia bombarda]
MAHRLAVWKHTYCLRWAHHVSRGSGWTKMRRRPSSIWHQAREPETALAFCSLGRPRDKTIQSLGVRHHACGEKNDDNVMQADDLSLALRENNGSIQEAAFFCLWCECGRRAGGWAVISGKQAIKHRQRILCDMAAWQHDRGMQARSDQMRRLKGRLEGTNRAFAPRIGQRAIRLIRAHATTIRVIERSSTPDSREASPTTGHRIDQEG